MACLFTDEVNTPKELAKYLKENKIEIPEYRPAVIALIVNKDNEILLQRRGPKSRDEQYKLEDIGGAYEKTDKNFREALLREIREEVGDEAKIKIDFFAGAFLINKFDRRTDSYVNWLFLLYKCTYLGGNLANNEEGKSIGYEFYKYEDLLNSDATNTVLEFWNFYHNEYKDI